MRRAVIGICLFLFVVGTFAACIVSCQTAQSNTLDFHSEVDFTNRHEKTQRNAGISREFDSLREDYLSPENGRAETQKKSMSLASDSEIHEYLNVTELTEGVWAEPSSGRILNDTKYISTYFPNRTWQDQEMSPSTNLQSAWEWANSTLKNITDSNVHFRLVTEYSHLLGRIEGTGESPRPAIIVSGIIESERTPGANDVGVSTAAVLETARLLYNYSFPFDVILTLLNGHYMKSDYDAGARAFVSWLVDNGTRIVTSFSFDKLLFHHSGFLYGTRIALRSDLSVSEQFRWARNFITCISEEYGSGRVITLENLQPSGISLAREMWRMGLPSIHIAQGYYDDSQSGSESDVWYNSDYNYAKAGEVVKSVAASTVYAGLLEGYKMPAYYSSGQINENSTVNQRTLLTIGGYFNATITWNSSDTFIGSIQDESGSEVFYRRVESDGIIHLKYKASRGMYRVILDYQGNETVEYSLNITLPNDNDGDGLADTLEYDLGTQPYLVDSDDDGLTDDFELSLGTNPIESDTDSDNLSDSIEYEWSSSPIKSDSDNDNLTDFREWEAGSDPNNNDTDSDGLSDWEELEIYQTDPTSEDSDGDGLEDGFEISYNLNPLSIDTDGDSLDDMFEVVNQINPRSPDSDGDGWGDAYEVENCMSPTDADTDGDGISDSIDWDPCNHWIILAAPVSLVVIVSLFIIFSALKYQVYRRE